jgi:type III secretory pathway component EscS
LRERAPRDDVDLPSPPPLLVFGVIAVLVTLFVAVTQLH